jgi:hypothetical protein
MSALPAQMNDPFAGARELFSKTESYLMSKDARNLTHSELERELEKRGQELMRSLLQAHLDVRGPGEAVGPVEDSDGVAREQKRLHERGLETIFGEVRVQRLGYGAEGVDSLHPLDADLNLPPELYSHEVRHRVAEEVANGSFAATVKKLSDHTGAHVGRRQVEELATRAAQDFDRFYEEREGDATRSGSTSGSILVISADQKGVVMRREDLREATRKKAETTQHKMVARLSRGEKRNAKRMATVAAVYTIAAHVRRPEDIVSVGAPHNEREEASRPRPEDKRVWASVEKEPEQVIKEAIREAIRRDPERMKTWAVLVDGSKSQIDILRKLFRRYGIIGGVLIVVDFVHVAEYVWKAGIAFCGEANDKLALWVSKHLLAILRGRSGHVAAGIRRSATLQKLDPKARKAVDSCARYLLNHSQYLRYDKYLALGLPIATGVIEGACRYLIKDRMDITGARWSLLGAESVLRLRALHSNGDLDEYWRFHEQKEYQRNHAAHYDEQKVVPIRDSARHPRLKRIK